MSWKVSVDSGQCVIEEDFLTALLYFIVSLYEQGISDSGVNGRMPTLAFWF